ncbi:hypothetical protein ACHAXA_004662 [Cyclostephanos tholiformis]|uniref:E2F/DP family winged-helix DNA-binding domain-containing protein n=1 Tax=Cyclostephanos tholiformis TaxID=382380 RepID=A0ABD3R897_9STRA
MSLPLPSPASEVKKQTAAHSLANLFTSEGGDNNGGGPAGGSFENDIVADLMASAEGGEEPAMKRIKTEEAAVAKELPAAAGVVESTPQRVAGASVLASLGQGGTVPPLPTPAGATSEVELSDGSAIQHDYLLQNLVHATQVTSPLSVPQVKGDNNFVHVLSAEAPSPADGEVGEATLPAVPQQPTKSRKEKSLGVLCANFMDLFKDMPPNRDNNGTVVEICQVADRLGVARRRIYDVINILESIDIVCRVKKNTYRWHGKDGLAEVFARMQREALLERAVAAGAREAAVDDAAPPVEQPSESPSASSKTKGMAQTCQKLIQIFLVTGRVDIGLAEAAEEVLGPLSPAEEADAAKAMKTKVRRMYDIANVLTSIGILSKENVGSTSLQNKPSFKWVYHVLPSELGNHIPPPPPVSTTGEDASSSSSSMMMIETAAAAAAAGAVGDTIPLAAVEGNPSSATLNAEELVSQEEQYEAMQVEV